MARYWFTPKTHGYGAYPSTWQGWAAVVGFTILILVLAAVMAVRPAIAGTVSVTGMLVWLALSTLLVAGFVWFCALKTDGPWRWRWGGDPD
jgi:hypothetical protein